MSTCILVHAICRSDVRYCQLDMPQEGVDVLVATPGRVSTLLEAEALNLEDCRAVVLDEVCLVCLFRVRNCAVWLCSIG